RERRATRDLRSGKYRYCRSRQLLQAEFGCSQGQAQAWVVGILVKKKFEGEQCSALVSLSQQRQTKVVGREPRDVRRQPTTIQGFVQMQGGVVPVRKFVLAQAQQGETEGDVWCQTGKPSKGLRRFLKSMSLVEQVAVFPPAFSPVRFRRQRLGIEVKRSVCITLGLSSL